MNTISPRASKLALQPIRFGEYLFEKRVITDEQLLDSLADHWARGGRLGSAISRRGYLSAREVEQHAAEYHSLSVVEIDN